MPASMTATRIPLVASQQGFAIKAMPQHAPSADAPAIAISTAQRLSAVPTLAIRRPAVVMTAGRKPVLTPPIKQERLNLVLRPPIHRIPDLTLPSYLRRSQLTVPVAPKPAPTEADVFVSPDGKVSYALPRYAIRFDKGGTVEEPSLAIVERDGVPVMVCTLHETPSPAAAEGRMELPHVLTVALKYRQPDLSGGSILRELPFASVLLDATETVVTAELPLVTPGMRQQVLAALGSLEFSATLVVGCGITAGVPADYVFKDTNEPGYAQRQLSIDQTMQPQPLVLSAAHLQRLGGSGSGVQPLIRHRKVFGNASHSYWQDPVEPARFFFLPDRFGLARADDGNRRPLLRIHAVAGTGEGDDAPRLAMEFIARPVIDMERVDNARPMLEEAARQRGGDGAVMLEIVPDPQPILRLALPQGGAPSHALTERRDADVDLETGVTHAETLALDDFRLVYEALRGASLALLRGEVRASMSGGDPEDVPFELRLDRTVGDVLVAIPGSPDGARIPCRIENGIESPLRIERLAASALVGGTPVVLRVDGLAAPARLAPGERLELTLVAAEPLTEAPEAIELDESGVVVEPDADAVWAAVFDRSAAAQMTRTVTVEAVPLLFSGTSDQAADRVAAFVVTVEHGGTVRLTETQLSGSTTVRIPVEPLITGAPMPPIRYRTETWWGAGGVGTSDWREAVGTILFPVKTPAPQD